MGRRPGPGVWGAAEPDGSATALAAARLENGFCLAYALHWGRRDVRHVYSKNLRIIGTNLGSILELRTIIDFVATGRLKPVIDRAFPLKDAREAVQYLKDRKNRGKVLLTPGA